MKKSGEIIDSRKKNVVNITGAYYFIQEWVYLKLQ